MNLTTRVKSKDWLVPAGLILLSLIPVIAGAFRMSQLSKGVVSVETERFYSSLTPIILHIIAVTIFSLLGAFQFSRSFRKNNPKWHRISGRILVVAGLTVAVSGIWMTLIYSWAQFDGFTLYVIRLIVGLLMTGFMIKSIDAIRRKKFLEHGDWMLRAYALAMGAGTQVFTHIPFFIFPNIQGETTRTICMVTGWIFNLAIAEWIIRKPSLNPNQAFAGTN